MDARVRPEAQLRQTVEPAVLSLARPGHLGPEFCEIAPRHWKREWRLRVLESLLGNYPIPDDHAVQPGRSLQQHTVGQPAQVLPGRHNHHTQIENPVSLGGLSMHRPG